MYIFIASSRFQPFEVAVLNAWWRHPEGLRAWSSWCWKNLTTPSTGGRLFQDVLALCSFFAWHIDIWMEHNKIKQFPKHMKHDQHDQHANVKRRAVGLRHGYAPILMIHFSMPWIASPRFWGGTPPWRIGGKTTLLCTWAGMTRQPNAWYTAVGKQIHGFFPNCLGSFCLAILRYSDVLWLRPIPSSLSLDSLRPFANGWARDCPRRRAMTAMAAMTAVVPPIAPSLPRPTAAALRPCRLVGGVGERCQRKEERVRPPGDHNSFTRRDNCSVSFTHQELLGCSLLSPTKVPVSMGRQGLPWCWRKARVQFQ